jgi:hypothetical protein
MKNEPSKLSLNARQVETAKPRDTAYKLSDGRGLYLMANAKDSKYWRIKYRYAGKEKKLSLESIPTYHLQKLVLSERRHERYWRTIRIPERSKKPPS